MAAYLTARLLTLAQQHSTGSIFFFFFLIKKRNKKNQGCEKLAKNYRPSLNTTELAETYIMV